MIEIGEVERDLPRAGRAHFYQPPTPPETIQRVPEHRATDAVEYDVGPASAGCRFHCGGNVDAAGSQRHSGLRDRRPWTRSFAIASDNPGTDAPGDLHGRVADPATGRDDQYRFPRAQTGAFHQSFP
jgi:hypothetical protein